MEKQSSEEFQRGALPNRDRWAVREADSSSWPFPLLPRALPLALPRMLGWVSPAWGRSGALQPIWGSVSEQGQLVRGLFLVESLDAGGMFVG